MGMLPTIRMPVTLLMVLEHEDRLALSDACVKKVQENYTEEVVAKQYTTLYEKLLKGE